MEPDRAIEIIHSLADVVDYSGERSRPTSYQHADTVCVHLALEGLTHLLPFKKLKC